MRENIEASLDEILNQADVTEDEEMNLRAQTIFRDMEQILLGHISQDDPEGFISSIREETAIPGDEHALFASMLNILTKEDLAHENFAQDVKDFLQTEREESESTEKEGVAVIGDK